MIWALGVLCVLLFIGYARSTRKYLRVLDIGETLRHYAVHLEDQLTDEGVKKARIEHLNCLRRNRLYDSMREKTGIPH
jgi:hypothetical protein